MKKILNNKNLPIKGDFCYIGKFIIFGIKKNPESKFGTYELAPEDTFLKLFDNLYTELKEREDIINSFVAQLKYTAKFDEKLRERFFPNESSLVNNDNTYQY